MFIYERFVVYARRKLIKEEWTVWTKVNDYDVAVRQAKKAEAAGFEAKIVDRGEQ